MKKTIVLAMSAVLLVSSCATGAGSGAYAGSSLGAILGSAIGGIAGGPRGSDIGTIIGMAGGAVVGGAMGDAAERQQRQEQYEMLSRRNERIQRQKQSQGVQRQYGDDTYTYGNNQDNFNPNDMVDKTNSGDDRIDLGVSPQNNQNGVRNSLAENQTSIESSRVEQITSGVPATGKLTIKNVRFTDTDGDGRLNGGEIGRVVFEIYNDTQSPIYNFMPTVVEADANKRIYISPSVRVENIMPGQGLRYTATVKADRRIKDGQIRLMVSAQKDGRPISYITVVKVDTQR
ncbi:hypothetical protein [Prevotella sp.]|uniref:hypothetical protein n=1 Tax=uncultured Prevotella sp. TaxID=159272 RepID=UPI0027E27008|nr:hypothetical protein [uncultured Prevotella sp.]